MGVTPAGARRLIDDGHEVIVETHAGAAVGFSDADYRAAGATMTSSPDGAWSCELVVKVKEIQPDEYRRLVAGTTIFSFAQINRDLGVTILLVEQNARAALQVASHGYVMEQGKVVLDGTASELAENEDVKEFYLGGSGGERRRFKNLKSFRRRKRWL